MFDLLYAIIFKHILIAKRKVFHHGIFICGYDVHLEQSPHQLFPFSQTFPFFFLVVDVLLSNLPLFPGYFKCEKLESFVFSELARSTQHNGLHSIAIIKGY